MRYSRQRELIFNTVLHNKVHPTADYIYNKLKLDYPELSLGTVYRNLNFLAENKMLLKISVPNGSDRFDGTLTPHHHLICRECGNVFDIDAPELEDLYRRAERKSGFVIDKCSMAFEGYCADCYKDKNNQNKDTSNA
ncbi:MAG: Fur family transcriptional regulator [Porcipelethomonas sp.]